MKAIIFMIIIVIPSIGIFLPDQLQAQYQIKGWVFGGGGGTASNDSYRTSGTYGQPLAGFMQNDSFHIHAGFWPLTSFSPVTSVDRREDHFPHQFRLDQNYPNPFNPVTQIRFSIREENNVRLVIYDLLGRKVADLINETIQPGEYTVNFEAGNLPSGVYIYRLQSGSYVNQKRMILLK
jgi:hypothetical protein